MTTIYPNNIFEKLEETLKIMYSTLSCWARVEKCFIPDQIDSDVKEISSPSFGRVDPRGNIPSDQHSSM